MSTSLPRSLANPVFTRSLPNSLTRFFSIHHHENPVKVQPPPESSLPDETKQNQQEQQQEENDDGGGGEDVNKETGEVGGPKGPEPTRYGDWERNGRCSDF
ncbi:hypothetical protein RIF29_37027 [Crotalaria pallida]|uniref:Succinate dehydrogenase assembly factor 4, mitochondrial n=1 Tax=Crotalaria pallida TaxID=3830 RepID=A0AAN9EII7_CROPI